MIIDDEPLARMLVEKYIAQIPQLELVATAGDGFEGLKKINEFKPDLLFLDIQMPKINDFEVLELLPNPPAIIFTTAFDEFALKAFEHHAVDYLLKPISSDRFELAVEKFLKLQTRTDIPAEFHSTQKQPDEQARIVIKDGSEIKIIPTAEIHYIEAYDDYVKFFLKDAYHIKKKTMRYFVNVLDSSLFVRIHRSYLLNIRELTKIESYEKNSYVAILKSGKRLPISRNSYTTLKEKLGI